MQKYEIIKKIDKDISILCGIAKVSKSGYYAWLMHVDEQDKDYEDYLIIKKIFHDGKEKYGFRTMRMKLEEKKILMNHKKILRIMRKYGLMAKIRKRNPYKDIMKKTIEHRTCDNKLERQFKQDKPFKAYCTDITYLRFNRGLAYLSAVKDISSGEAIVWNLSRNLEMSIVMDTLKKMERNYNIPSLENAMIHSDQGFHYTNPLYIQKVKKLNMVQSMSRKGNCIDNAPIESFFGHLKDEIDYKNCKTFEDLYNAIEQYMYYYNNERRQWGLKKMTPVEYRNHLLSTA